MSLPSSNRYGVECGGVPDAQSDPYRPAKISVFVTLLPGLRSTASLLHGWLGCIHALAGKKQNVAWQAGSRQVSALATETGSLFQALSQWCLGADATPTSTGSNQHLPGPIFWNFDAAGATLPASWSRMAVILAGVESILSIAAPMRLSKLFWPNWQRPSRGLLKKPLR